jgi:predicted DNA-binding antitoxin AbrB/MazE fold protein
MTAAFEAIYENGVLVPEKPLDLKEHAKVRILVEAEEAAPTTSDDDPTGWKTARELIGCIKDAPEDVSENHDKYLYGDPSK